jgi:surfeit locus 1 family protein
VVVIVLTGLGTWQLHRKAWKEALIEALEQRLSAPPVALPARERWPTLDAARDEFLRVRFSAAFVPGAEALVYAAASAFRPDVSGAGYWVLAPARITGDDTIVVNRGFVPEGRQDPGTRTSGEVAAPQELVGVMRWPEPRGPFTPPDDPGRNLWFVRDPVAIAAAKGWGEVAPFYVELEGPLPPSGLPRAGSLRPSLRNEHLQYAVTWFGLAVAAAVMFALWVIQRERTASR